MNNSIKALDNRNLEILSIIQKKGPITKKLLLEITGMTLTTLNRVMKNLEEKKLLVEFGASESTGGRKAIEYEVSAIGFYSIGIDISRTYVKIVVTNLKLIIMKKEEFIMDESFSPEKTLDKIVSIIEQMLLDLHINKDEILGIGVGTVGPIDREKGIILEPKGFFNEFWDNVAIKARLEEKLNLTCYIDNGANTAILAEALYGIGKELKTLVYIHCGIGIRSAIITDGKIIRAINDGEDAFGNMVVAYKGEANGDLSYGTVENYSTIEAIVDKINEKRTAPIKINEINYKNALIAEVFNSREALKIIDEGAEMLGIGLLNLVRFMNPQLIILSGPLIMNFMHYYEKCIESFNKYSEFQHKVLFNKGGVFKEDIIAIGAAAMIIELHFAKMDNKI